MRTVNLREMKTNETGIIRTVGAEGELGRRIRDMGIIPGARIRLRGRAPLFDPVAVQVSGTTLTLRNNEADFIDVELQNTAETTIQS